MRYFIEPQNEPWGEGNGWDKCPEAKAKTFSVFEGPNDVDAVLVESFDTRTQAEDWIAAQEQGDQK